MFKNLVKKVKSFAKKAAPYAGLVAGAFGMNPMAAAGIGALLGGMGGGGMKGAMMGGLGGYMGGKMFGADNPLFNTGFGREHFFSDKVAQNLANKGFLNKGVFANMNPLIGEGGNIFDTAVKYDKEGNIIKKGMMDYLPLVGLGTGIAYAGGLFDEPPIPEDAIPKEYKYDPDKDPLKNINQKFADIYGNYSPIPSTSIYGYLDSMGLGGFGNKNGGVMAFADGGRREDYIAESMTAIIPPEMMDEKMMQTRAETDLEKLFKIMNPNLPENLDEYEFGEAYTDEDGNTKVELIKKTEEDTAGEKALKSLMTAEEFAETKMGANPVDPLDSLKRAQASLARAEKFANGRDTNPPMEQLIVPNPNLPSSQGIMEESGILSLEELEMYIEQLTMMKNAGELSEEQFQMAVQMVMQKAGQTQAAQNGGIAQFNYGGEIMGPGTGREDIIPGKIVDKNTGQTSDMLVSNNEHIIPEYTLYAMGGGDTEKGHEMMNKLRSETKSIASKMGYDFKGAEDGSVRYG